MLPGEDMYCTGPKQLVSNKYVWSLPGDNALRKDGTESEHKSEGQPRAGLVHGHVVKVGGNVFILA